MKTVHWLRYFLGKFVLSKFFLSHAPRGKYRRTRMGIQSFIHDGISELLLLRLKDVDFVCREHHGKLEHRYFLGGPIRENRV